MPDDKQETIGEFVPQMGSLASGYWCIDYFMCSESAPILTPAGRPESVAKVRSMFDSIASRYDLLNFVLSGGCHKIWESKLVRQLPEDPKARCLDLCTGTGALVPNLAKRYREVIGVDISSEMLNVARKRWGHLENVVFCEGNALDLSYSDSEFDAVTIAYGVRNWPDFPLGLREVYRIVQTGGSVAILEFGQPQNAIWRGLFGLYSRYVIPTLGGLISGNRAPYQYLPKTAASFPCGEDFVSILKEVGFSGIRQRSLLGGIAYIYIAQKF